jgi:hypothetical protein
VSEKLWKRVDESTERVEQMPKELRGSPQNSRSPSAPQAANYVQQLPGGICFAHGPYEKGYQCPRWPACGTDPQKPEYLAMGKQSSAPQAAKPDPDFSGMATDEQYHKLCDELAPPSRSSKQERFPL